MAEDSIRYDLRAQDALRNVIRDVLSEVAVSGLPGEHHFFITFRTRAEGVGLSPRLKEQHPEEMTVVMQHWYEGLTVDENGFAVTLNFGDTPEPLYIPFDSIRTFVDPSVEFGLRFETQESDLDEAEDEDDEAPAERKDAEVVSLDKWRK